MVARARELRKQATSQENHLWFDYLSAYPVRFRRQHVFEGYIVDFYCPKAKLVIELDGKQHHDAQHAAYDMERTKWLQAQGIQVLRFDNQDVEKEFQDICQRIDAAVKSRIQPGGDTNP